MSWMRDHYARLLVDNHITDLHPEFMRKYDPEEYVALVRKTGVGTAMVYSCDHNGNCYYPTKVGHPHKNLEGRDLFGENIRQLRKAGISPVAYYTVIYHNDAAARYPEASVVDNLGNTHDRRYHYVCPNHPKSLDFFQRQLTEILQYDIDGIFLDMTFWPAVCCCEACREKYGKPLPETIDWNNPEWVQFQRWRESTLADFAKALTEHIKGIRPECSVTHQFSPVLHGWLFGQSDGISAVSDYASGDFYGEKLQQRFGTKAFAAHTRNGVPFEFMTSRCVSLYDHTSRKSPEEITLSAMTTLANGGAYLFIDAINPDGTFFRPFYEELAQINRYLKPYCDSVSQIHGHLYAETGLYFSMECSVDHSLNGTPFSQYDGGRANNMAARGNAIFNEILGTSEVLTEMHIPYRVLTPSTSDFSHLKTIIINDAAYLSEEECRRLRNFVKEGGQLIATGRTSYRNRQGETTGDFQLADLFGIHWDGPLSDQVNYTGEEKILADGPAPLVTADPDTEIRAWLTFPYFPANDPEQYAAIHSNPPDSTPSGFPAITWHTYGKGACLWIAAPFLRLRQHTQQKFAQTLFRDVLPPFLLQENHLPESAELTLLKGECPGQWILTLVNQQNQFPPIPLHRVSCTLRLPFTPKRVTQISTGKEANWCSPEEKTFQFSLDEIFYGEFLLLEE